VAEAFTTEKGELILALLAGPGAPHDDATEPPPLMLVTATGVMKRVSAADIVGTANGKPVIGLKPGDSVVAAFEAPDTSDVLAVSSNAQATRVSCAAVPVQGRGAGGVAGMKLSDGSTVVGAGPVVGNDTVVLTVTDRLTAKVTDADEIPAKGRGTGGLRITKFRDERAVEFAYVGPESGLNVIVGSIESPTKPDPNPEPLTIPHTGRDLVSKAIPRRILAVGFGRW